MAKFIHLIADYGESDPAFSEVIHRFKAIEPSIQVQPTSVPAFSTVATGFWIAQYGLYNPSFDELCVYANTAPRKDDTDKREQNHGEELLYARLDNGVPVVAVNSGHTFSFIKHRIDELREVRTKNKGSQFRSRDYYPEAVAHISESNPTYLGNKVDKSDIPEPPEDVIGWIDGYGNIKTTRRESQIDLEPGTEIEIELNNTIRKAYYEKGTFEVPEGELSFAAGSSGGEDAFMEIFLRGGNAAKTFGEPEVGDQVKITPVG